MMQVDFCQAIPRVRHPRAQSRGSSQRRTLIIFHPTKILQTSQQSGPSARRTLQFGLTLERGALHCSFGTRRPPLSCRTSPPQGGRSAHRRFLPISKSNDWQKATARSDLPTRGGDVRQDRGGRLAPGLNRMSVVTSPKMTPRSVDCSKISATCWKAH